MHKVDFAYTGSTQNTKEIKRRNDFCRKHIGPYDKGWYYKKDLKQGIVTYYLDTTNKSWLLVSMMQ